MEDSDIGEIEIKDGEDSVRISRYTTPESGYPVSGDPELVVRRSRPGAGTARNTNQKGRVVKRATRRAAYNSAPSSPSGTYSISKGRPGPAKREQREDRPGYHIVNAPMVGTFYHAPDPDSAPFVEVGTAVKVGDTLCIIESMKMMNRIVAEFDGIVEEIHVKNDSGVEYDQALFTLTNLPD